MTRATPLDPDARRASLLAAAREVFAEKGYHGSGVADIIERAGVARGTFYNYFESKRAVLGAVLDELTEHLAAAVKPIDLRRPMDAQVRDDLRRVVEALTSSAHVSRLLFSESVGIDDEGDAAIRSFYTAALGRLQGALELGQAAGVVRAGEPKLMARSLLGMVKEPVFQASLYGEQVDVAELVDELAAFLRHGALK